MLTTKLADWSQFCGKAMLNFFLSSLQLFMVVGGWVHGKYVEIDDSCFSR
jgi:hypothetical protein